MESSTPLLVLLALAAIVVAGTGMQRVAGLGFSLVASPPFVLLLGPVLGVVLVNVCGVVVAGILTLRSLRDIDWRRWAILAAAAVVGVIPGAFLVAALPRDWLDILVGALILVGLAASLVVRTQVDPVRRGPLAIAGVVSGAMNVTAGVAGPAVAVFGVLAGWTGRGFAATVQPLFFAIGSASIAAKFAIAPPGGMTWDPLVWVVLIASCVVGMGVAEPVAVRVSPRIARRLLLVLATAGALTVLGRGILDAIGVV